MAKSVLLTIAAMPPSSSGTSTIRPSRIVAPTRDPHPAMSSGGVPGGVWPAGPCSVVVIRRPPGAIDQPRSPDGGERTMTRREDNAKSRYLDIIMDRAPRRTPADPNTAALFVRLPPSEARKRDRAAPAVGAPKKDLVAGLVARYVDPDSDDGLHLLRRLGAEEPRRM